MKATILLAIFTVATAYSQITNYLTVPPVNKKLKEVLKIEKIDTTKHKYLYDYIVIQSKIGQDSATISYKFEGEKLAAKYLRIHLPDHTIKAALKRFRYVNQQLAGKYGQPLYSEVMEDLPATDQLKSLGIAKGQSLMSVFETDTFYVTTACRQDEDTNILQVVITYISPEQWNQIFN